ncbi:YceI family protein [Pedobacter zeae]|nr:YceI family protein [Pedobacter zeae]MBB4106695.1 polyisoprenoid-binding protein YceI [Pedobacter zeae]
MTTKWTLDPTHSDITFKVKHMMISNVSGNFTDFNIEVDTEDDTFTNAKTSVTIKTDSVSTNNTDRDNHLKSADFFNVEQNPTITFESSAVNVNDGLTGNLTINGITKSVTIDLNFNGIEVDPYGFSRAGFSFEGKVNRKDFGLTWNSALETGGLMIGEEVKLAGDLQFVKQVQED